MRQFLFPVPFTAWFDPPDGFWLPGYGLMLLLAFVVVVAWGGRRSIPVGLPAPKVQDMAMVLFITGIVGARILYMYQYSHKYTDHTFTGLLIGFVSIWKGGLVVYGAVFGGFTGYLFFRHYVIKRMGINSWQLADVVAPLLAIGMAVGRIGCYLNGCCWGQVALEECQPVPLGTICGQFPMLPAHARTQLCYDVDTFKQVEPDGTVGLPQIFGLQTSTGFSVRTDDPRVIDAVERGSDAEKAGLKSGDVIVRVNDLVNETTPGGDTLSGLVRRWPKGGAALKLGLQRGGAEITIEYTPRTITFFPTQIYETVSMLLLTLLLICYQPFRRRDGMVMVMLMLGYAAHRFLNEAIRIEPTYAMGLTLSQWISVLIFAAGLGLGVFLQRTQPRLPLGAPLGFTPAAVPSGSVSAVPTASP